jgi:hypothetical protein
MNMKQKSERMKELTAELKTHNQKEYMNYSVHEDGKIFGVPLKGQETYKNCLELVSNPVEHASYYNIRIELLDIRASIFNYSDPKINKQIKNLKTYQKRFENAVKKAKKLEAEAV